MFIKLNGKTSLEHISLHSSIIQTIKDEVFVNLIHESICIDLQSPTLSLMSWKAFVEDSFSVENSFNFLRVPLIGINLAGYRVNARCLKENCWLFHGFRKSIFILSSPCMESSLNKGVISSYEFNRCDWLSICIF